MTTELRHCAICEKGRPSEPLPRRWVVLDDVDRVLICPYCWRALLLRAPKLRVADRILTAHRSEA